MNQKITSSSEAKSANPLLIAAVMLILLANIVFATEPAKISIISDSEGSRLQVDGRDFMVLGMNWEPESDLLMYKEQLFVTSAFLWEDTFKNRVNAIALSTEM